MKKLLFLQVLSIIAVLFLINDSKAQQPDPLAGGEKVLWIGNSYSAWCTHIISNLDALCEASNIHGVNFQQQGKGMGILKEYCECILPTMDVKAKIQEGGWDIVIFQGWEDSYHRRDWEYEDCNNSNPHIDGSQYTGWPGARDTFVLYAEKLVQEVHNIGGKAILQQPHIGIRVTDDMRNKSWETFTAAASATGAYIMPSLMAFDSAHNYWTVYTDGGGNPIKTADPDNVWNLLYNTGDGGHQNSNGMALETYFCYTVLTGGKSPVGLEPDNLPTKYDCNGTFTVEIQQELQEIAYRKGLEWLGLVSPSDDQTEPTQPVNTIVSGIAGDGFTISWDPCTDVYGTVAYDVTVDGNRINITDITVNSYTVTGLTPGTYQVKVYAHDEYGNYSLPSTAEEVSTTINRADCGTISHSPLDLPAGSTKTVEGAIENLVDGLLATDVNVPKQNGASVWIQYQFCSGNTYAINGYSIVKNETDNWAPVNSVLEGSNDGSTWDVLDSYTGVSFTANEVQYFSFDNTSAYEYYRFTFGNSSDWLRIAEIQLLEMPVVVPDNEAPTVPQNVAVVTNSPNGITLDWDASTDNIGVSSYEVFVDGISDGITVVTGKTVSGLTSGTEYTFTVVANDAAGNSSAASTPLVVTTSEQDMFPPSVPENLVVTDTTATSFTLAWSPSTDNYGVDEYEVYIDDLMEATTTDTFITITGLTPETAYSASVLAKDEGGNESDKSTAINLTTLVQVSTDDEAPSVPANLAASSITTTTFELSWDVSTDNVAVTGYEIYVDAVKVGNTTSTTVELSGFLPNTTYSVYVTAYDAAGNVSANSSTINVQTESFVVADTEAPSVPTGLGATYITYSGFTVSWNSSVDNNMLEGYQVYINDVLAATVSDTSYTFVDMDEGTTYQISVTAYDTADNFSAKSTVLDVAMPIHVGMAVSKLPAINLYPNPANDIITLFSGKSIRYIQILDFNGREMEFRINQTGVNVIEIDIRNYPGGMYMVKIFGNQFEKSILFIKQ